LAQAVGEHELILSRGDPAASDLMRGSHGATAQWRAKNLHLHY